MIASQPTSAALLIAVERAIQAEAQLSPAERAARRRAQCRSMVLAEAAFGSDADEAAYRAALGAGDAEAVARLDAAAAERRRQAAEILDRLGLC